MPQLRVRAPCQDLVRPAAFGVAAEAGVAGPPPPQHDALDVPEARQGLVRGSAVPQLVEHRGPQMQK
eukprot:5715230-Lingulodinium_polyedra.AAC.1